MQSIENGDDKIGCPAILRKPHHSISPNLKKMATISNEPEHQKM